MRSSVSIIMDDLPDLYPYLEGAPVYLRRLMRHYWPVPDAAKLLERVTGKRVSTAVLYRLIREGKLAAIRPAGMRTHIRPADISWARLSRAGARRMLK